MRAEQQVTVYRFQRQDGVAPRHMWGTLDAIAQLDGCAPLMESARAVHRKLLEAGFLFEQVPSLFIAIEETKGEGE
jgi:hypothetical protein